MQLFRLFEMVCLLLDRKILTAKELAAHFEVSARTIYRDIDALSQAGIPIYTEKGRNGGIRLMDNYVLNRSLLSAREKTEILSALQSFSATGALSHSTALTKLSALFDTPCDDWISIDFSDWSNQQQTLFSTVRTAILEHRLLTFLYYGSNGQASSRMVEPVQLWWKGHTWYLKTFCRDKQDFRTFKLTRMKQVAAMDETFSPRALPIESDLNDSAFISPLPVVLKADASQAYRIYDDFKEQEIQPVFRSDGASDGFLIHTAYPPGDWIYGFILSYGAHIQVLEPVFLREEIKRRLKKALENYQ